VSERQYLDITDTRVAALGSLLVEAARAGRVMDLSDQSGGQHLTGTVVVFSQGLPRWGDGARSRSTNGSS
jgi:hypothetical protein